MEYWYSKEDWEKMTNEEQKELEDYLEQEEGCVRISFRILISNLDLVLCLPAKDTMKAC